LSVCLNLTNEYRVQDNRVKAEVIKTFGWLFFLKLLTNKKCLNYALLFYEASRQQEQKQSERGKQEFVCLILSLSD